MHGKKIFIRTRALRVGLVVGVAAAAVFSTAMPAFAAAHVLTLNVTQGPSNGGNTIVATTPTVTPTFVASVAVQFQFAGVTALPLTPAAAPLTASAACWPTYVTQITPTAPVTAPGVVNATSVVKYSANKLYITVPNGAAGTGLILISPQTTAKYHVCVYSGTTPGTSGSPLIAGTGAAATQYQIAAAATITSISPVSGPSKGGTLITVVGSNLTGATASLGGAPLSTLVVAADGLSFTATTSAHVAEPLAVVLAVTTVGGTTNKLSAYTYSNGIIVTPNTAPRSALSGTYVEIAGVGFSGLIFTGTTGTTSNNAGAHVYLNRGTYDPADVGVVTPQKNVGQLLECTDVLVMSDVLLLCKLGLTPMARTFNATITGTTVVTSATAHFTAADIGMGVSGTGVAADTSIVSITSPTTAVISAAATNATVDVTVAKTRDVVVTALGTDATLTSAAALFTVADIGRPVTGTGIVAGTTIVSITSPTEVELSAAHTAANLATATITNVVLDGTYTVTVVSDGSVDAADDPDYVQSIMSSGATFTIGEYLVR